MTPTYAPGAALVTGGSGGIGAAVVRALVGLGIPVASTYRRHPESSVPGVPAFPWSTSSAADAAGLLRQAEAAVGPVRYLVGCTGIAQESAFFRVTEPEWQEIVSTNLTANLALVRAAVAPMMKAGFGRIVLVGSASGRRGIAGHTVYAATKAGLDAFARALAVECAGFGVTVNTVAPGYIDTPMLAALPEARRKSLAEGIPLKRLGTPADVAASIAFLLSEQAAYVTGQTLGVDGGLSA